MRQPVYYPITIEWMRCDMSRDWTILNQRFSIVKVSLRRLRSNCVLAFAIFIFLLLRASWERLTVMTNFVSNTVIDIAVTKQNGLVLAEGC